MICLRSVQSFSMSFSDEKIERKLSPEIAKERDLEAIPVDEISFRWMINQDEMATEKLAQGIRKFNADYLELACYIADKFPHY